MPRGLLPSMKYVVRAPMCTFVALSDVMFDVVAHSATEIPGAVEQIGIVNARRVHRGNLDFNPRFRAAFHDAVSLHEVLESICERGAAVQRLRDLGGVGA